MTNHVVEYILLHKNKDANLWEKTHRCINSNEIEISEKKKNNIKNIKWPDSSFFAVVIFISTIKLLLTSTDVE